MRPLNRYNYFKLAVECPLYSCYEVRPDFEVKELILFHYYNRSFFLEATVDGLQKWLLAVLLVSRNYRPLGYSPTSGNCFLVARRILAISGNRFSDFANRAKKKHFFKLEGGPPTIPTRSNIKSRDYLKPQPLHLKVTSDQIADIFLLYLLQLIL